MPENPNANVSQLLISSDTIRHEMALQTDLIIPGRMRSRNECIHDMQGLPLQIV